MGRPAAVSLSLVVVSIAVPSACISSTSDRTAADTQDASEPDAGEPCSGGGDTRCSADGTALEVCTSGHWQSTGCGEGRICVDVGAAQCLDTNGDEPCRQMLYCYLGCDLGPEQVKPTCLLNCYFAGTVEAQSQLASFQTCTERTSCIGGDSVTDTLECIDGACRSELGTCYFPTSGNASCAQILTCYETCGDDEECKSGCGNDASLDAQGRFGILELCVFFACADKPDDGNCLDNAIGLNGTCAPFARRCLNPLGE